jgi:hypothetical protein
LRRPAIGVAVAPAISPCRGRRKSPIAFSPLAVAFMREEQRDLGVVAIRVSPDPAVEPSTVGADGSREVVRIDAPYGNRSRSIRRNERPDFQPPHSRRRPIAARWQSRGRAVSPTARRLELEHAAELAKWLRVNRILEHNVGRLAEDLATYLLDWGLRTPQEGARFLAAVPLVIARCDDDIYGDQAVADAYAWVHLLERYRRAWLALYALFDVGRLPLARKGLEVLDVGTGPAPVLYAVSDFHAAVRAFADEADIDDLRLEPPHLSSVEESGAMTHLVHVISEIGRRPRGPYRADFRSILEVAPEELREHRRAFEVRRLMEEEGIGDERTANRMVSEAGYVESSFRYRFVVFSNFLTTSDSVIRWSEPLTAMARSLYPGGLSFVMGAAGGDKYRTIYRDVAVLMSESGLRAVDELPAVLNSDADASGLREIKKLWTRVWRRLQALDVADTTRLEGWPDLWDPDVAPRGRLFAIRAFRRVGRF